MPRRRLRGGCFHSPSESQASRTSPAYLSSVGQSSDDAAHWHWPRDEPRRELLGAELRICCERNKSFVLPAAERRRCRSSCRLLHRIMIMIIRKVCCQCHGFRLVNLKAESRSWWRPCGVTGPGMLFRQVQVPEQPWLLQLRRAPALFKLPEIQVARAATVMATMAVTDQTQTVSKPESESSEGGRRAWPRRVQGPANPETGRRKLQLEMRCPPPGPRAARRRRRRY